MSLKIFFKDRHRLYFSESYKGKDNMKSDLETESTDCFEELIPKYFTAQVSTK